MSPNNSGSGRTPPNPLASEALDRCLRLLSDTDRRIVLSHLMTNGEGPVSLDTLVAELARHRGPLLDREACRISLHHRHLPRLDRAGVVSYDIDSRQAVYQGDDLLEECHRALSTVDRL